MLKISDLRQEAYSAWELLCGAKGIYTGASRSDELPEAVAQQLPWTNALFKAEIRKVYGDIRYRRTWEQAAIDLTAHQMVQSYLEPYQIVGYIASPTYMRCPIREYYGEQVIEKMLQFPEIVEIVKAGLDQLYYDPVTPADKAVAMAFLDIQTTNQIPPSPLPHAANGN